jgi:adenylate cyclase
MPAARTAQALARLLDRRNQHPEHLQAIDREICARFQQRHAVFVLDMCGFSRLTVRHGIVHFLAMIRRLHRLVGPIIRQARGRVVKLEADNVFAVFPDVPPALRAARQVNIEVARDNAVLPADWDFQASIGIGYGDLLMVGAHDFYGSELNLAAKLGEDLAGPGEILLTEAAQARAGAARRRLKRRPLRAGGLRLNCYAAPDVRPPRLSRSGR